MIRDFPPDWTPEWPPEPGPLAQRVDALFERFPFWDQWLVFVGFGAFLVGYCIAVVYMA